MCEGCQAMSWPERVLDHIGRMEPPTTDYLQTRIDADGNQTTRYVRANSHD